MILFVIMYQLHGVVLCRTCLGSHHGLNKVSLSNYRNLLQMLATIYSRCTKVDGNLEITHLNATPTSNFAFLGDIEEVTGYVLIGYNKLRGQIVLPKLRFIRGKNTIKTSPYSKQFALLLQSNKFDLVKMPNLIRVEGNVGVVDNSNLCYWQTLDFWSLIGHQREVIHSSIPLVCRDKRVCPCQHCFSAEPEDCQKTFRNNCSDQCADEQCFGTPINSVCCSNQCRSGCAGTLIDQCYDCMHFRQGSTCVDECDRSFLEYGDLCVIHCPNSTYKLASTCVDKCPSGYKTNELSECEPCNDINNCHDVCVHRGLVTSRTIGKFENCTRLEGNIKLNAASFTAGPEFDDEFNMLSPFVEPLTADDLEKLSNLVYVSEFVSVQMPDLNITQSITFLRNLEQIGGKRFFDGTLASLVIASCDLVDSIDLGKLRRVDHGNVVIRNNRHLCQLNLTRSIVAESRMQVQRISYCFLSMGDYKNYPPRTNNVT